MISPATPDSLQKVTRVENRELEIVRGGREVACAGNGELLIAVQKSRRRATGGERERTERVTGERKEELFHFFQVLASSDLGLSR